MPDDTPIDVSQGTLDAGPIPGPVAAPPAVAPEVPLAPLSPNVTQGPQLPERPIGTSVAAQPVDRKQQWRQMLGDFLYSVGQGLANRGSGPDADLRGAGAAINAIPNRNIQQQQIAIQREQAEAAQRYKEAQAASLTPSISMIDPNGNTVMVPPAHVGQALAAQYRLAGTLGSAGIKAQTAEKVQNLKNEGNLDVVNAKKTPVNQVLQEAQDAYTKGDMDTYNAKLKQAGQMSSATSKPGKDNEISLIQKALGGDKDAAAAYKQLQQGRMQVRAVSATMRPMNFYDPNLQRNVTMSAAEAERRQQAGESLIPSGAVPANTILQMQRAQTAIPNAVDDVSKSLGAWDNAGDRAIFAKIMKENPMGSDPAGWFTNVTNQALTSGLSPEGRDAVVKLRRLNESLGTLRAISGLPSTAGSMVATAALLPGPTTPDSKMAKAQLEQIKTLVQQETGVPFLGAGGTSKTPKAASGGKNYSSDNPFANKK